MPASLLRGALRTPGEDDTSLDHDVPTEFCNTKLTHGHDLTGHRSSPARGLLPRLRSCASLARRHVESRVDLRDHLDAPSRAHHPCANAWRDRTRAVRPAPKVSPRTRAADDRGATIYPHRSLARRQVTLTRHETPDGFRLQRHGPEVPSEGLARSTPLLRGCSARVPLLESLRTSSCHRSPARASWREIRPPTSTGQDRRLVRHPAKDGAFSTARMFGYAPR